MKNISMKAFKITQTLSIIALVVALLLSAMYFLITTSVNKALADQTAPQLFGYYYVPIADKKITDLGLGAVGDLLVFEEIDAAKATVGSTVLFKNPQVIESNLSLAAYQDYSVGVINKADTVENSPVFHVTNSKDSPVIVAQQLITAKGSYAVSVLGSVITGILSNLGIFYYVLLPALIFVAFQITAIILKMAAPKPEEILSKTDDNEEDDEEIEVIPYPLGSLGKFTQKSLLLDESLVSDVPSTPSLENTIKSETISTLNTDFMSKSALTKSTSSTYDTLEKIDLSQKPLPTFTAEDLLSTPSKQPSLNNTIEFDLNEVREQLLQESLPKESTLIETPPTPVVPDEIFSLNNLISMELKENALDFDFKNILSDKISIEQNDAGDGFSIITPNYTANIKIEITK